MNRINIDWITTFLEAARFEHLGKTADALQTDQSTISRKIARLEDEIGVALFERVGRQVRLTQAGKRFVVKAERVLKDLREAIDDAALTISPDHGEIHIAFLHTIGATWLPGQIAPFHEAFPHVRFLLTDATANEVVRTVLDGDVDLGILGPPPRDTPDLETKPLFRERIAVVVPTSHPLATLTSCTLAQLEHESLILTRSRSGLRGIIDEAFSNHGLTPHVAYEGDDFSIIQGLVEAGLGISLLPTPLSNPSTKIKAVPLVSPIIERTVIVCWDRRRDLPPAVRQFLTHLTSRFPV